MLLWSAIFSVSAATLTYEVLLMRLLNIVQWSHFAYMIISLALLGFGASGTFLTIFREPLLKRFSWAASLNAALFGLSATAAFALINTIPLNPLEMFWDKKQFFYLFGTYFILAFPFFFSANCIGLSFSKFAEKIHRVYLCDLLGAGCGGLSAILLLFRLHPLTCLKIVSGMGFIAAVLFWLSARKSRSLGFACILIAAGLGVSFAWPNDWLRLRLSPYKGLNTALHVLGARKLMERSSPLGWLAVVESPMIPFRYAPGLSLNCPSEPPPQLGIFVDGDSMSPVSRFDGHTESLAFVDCLPSAIPYRLLRNPKVLILGSGGGMDVLMALYYRAKQIDAVELNPQMTDLVQKDFADFSGMPYSRKGVRLANAEARGFITRSNELYDLIVVSLLDSFNTSSAGGYALNETYLYTVEALKEYISHLRPDGILAITRWLKVPPRDSLKLFATAIAALKQSGLDDPSGRLALIRSWKTTTLLVKREKFTVAQSSAIRKFCEERSFDTAYRPGIEPLEVNRFNILDQPYLYQGAQALLGEGNNEFMERYKFNIAPATDDRPYFFHFFKWRTFPEIMALKSQGGLALMEWPYPILVMTLLQALATSILLIWLPLRSVGGARIHRAVRWQAATYFTCLGLAFLFIEIAFIQKFILFLSHPLYAVSVVLSSLLVFAGLGSGFAHRFKRFWESFASWKGLPIVCAILGILFFSVLYLALLSFLFEHFMRVPDAYKIIISVLLIAPLAFFMGMPFPLGLSTLTEISPALVPWAWGINGCTSVISAVLATILAIHLGFRSVVIFALGLYGIAAIAMWRLPGRLNDAPHG